MRNVVRRYDTIAIPPPIKTSTKNTKEVKTTAETVEEISTTRSTKAVRQDDTPPLGSLGGQLPIALYVPKVKPPKVNKKKPAPGQMKIFDSQGRQWGRRKWKEQEVTAKVEV
jgi:hypothetical protein